MVTTTAKPVHRLPIQPPTALAVLKHVSQPEVETAVLARLVEVDPALTAMVLRMANSPLFGFSGRVASARQATVLLGTKTVGSLAVGGTASLVFGTRDEPTTPGAWAHAVTVACASAATARFLGVNPEEAFTAGILHNAAVLQAGSVHLHDDAEHPGRCAADCSADLLRSWGLPNGLVRAVRSHAQSRDGVTDGLATSVLLGHALSAAVEGTEPEGPTSPKDAYAALGAGSGRFEEVLSSIHRDIEGIAKFLETEAA